MDRKKSEPNEITKKSDPLDLWVKEIFQDTMGLSFKIEKTLFSGKSKYQKVDVVKTADHGAMLLNDGMVMVSERDEFVYHEMIAHVPLFTHPSPEKVLIIGGGDGGTAREVLKHKNIKRVVNVEIDEMVVNASKEFLPELSSSFSDPRLELLIEDGVQFVKDTKEKFDIILIDSTDPIGPATPLFNKTFYRNGSEILSKNGILISQAESPFYNQDIQKSMFTNQRPFFKKLNLFLLSNITYPGGLWSFGFASTGLDPIRDFKKERVKKAGFTTRYYNHDVHKAAFCLPEFIKKNLAEIVDTVDT